VPDQCQITFAQILSVMVLEDPTSSKSTKYAQLVDRIHSNATAYGAGYSFIKDYDYVLGADQLSIFGQQQMINSGIKYYDGTRRSPKTLPLSSAPPARIES